MADATIRFELVCPEGMVMDQHVEHVLVPGAEGDFMVLPEHAPVISTLRPGILEVAGTNGKSEKKYFVNAGLAEVSPTSLTILAQQAIDTATLDDNFFANEIRILEQDLEQSHDQDNKDILATKIHTMRSIAETLK